MSVVTYFVETAEGYLNTAAETQFGAVAATVGTMLVLGTTLVVILVFINMIYQYRAMDGRTAFWLAVKVGLIGVFATNWVQFNILAAAILNGIDSIAGSLVASVGGGSPGPSGTFAEEFDEQVRRDLRGTPPPQVTVRLDDGDRDARVLRRCDACEPLVAGTRLLAGQVARLAGHLDLPEPIAAA